MPGTGNCRDILHHRLAVWHFDSDDNIILACRHIDTEHPPTQLLHDCLTGLITFDDVFGVFGALISPIQKAKKRRHDLLPIMPHPLSELLPALTASATMSIAWITTGALSIMMLCPECVSVICTAPGTSAASSFWAAEFARSTTAPKSDGVSDGRSPAWMSFGTTSMNLSLAVSTTTGMGLNAAAAAVWSRVSSKSCRSRSG